MPGQFRSLNPAKLVFSWLCEEAKIPVCACSCSKMNRKGWCQRFISFYHVIDLLDILHLYLQLQAAECLAFKDPMCNILKDLLAWNEAENTYVAV